MHPTANYLKSDKLLGRQLSGEIVVGNDLDPVYQEEFEGVGPSPVPGTYLKILTT
jgi:hypothetical protein